MNRRLISEPVADRARRSVREITIALALTVAAAIFILAAFKGGGSETASIDQASTPVVSRQN